MTDTVPASEIRAFRDSFTSVLIASCGASCGASYGASSGANSGTSADTNIGPHASYAPTISDNHDNLIIFISDLARHTGNLLTNPRAGLMFIEDEANNKNPFARRRLSYDCRVSELAVDTSEGAALLDALEQRFGNIVRRLRQLPDFHLLRLTPVQGSYVKGFGAAYRWQGALPRSDIDRVTPSQPNARY